MYELQGTQRKYQVSYMHDNGLDRLANADSNIK